MKNDILKKRKINEYIVAVCVLLPFLLEVISTQVNFSYNVQTIMATYFISLTYLYSNSKQSIKSKSAKLISIWFTLIFASLFSAMFSDDIILTLQRIITILVTSLFLIILVSIDEYKEKTFLIILKLFSAMSVGLTLIAIMINLLGYTTIYNNWRIVKLDIGPISIFQRLAGAETDALGVSSLFFNPNNFAGFLLIGLTSSLIILNQKNIDRKKIMLTIILIYIGIEMTKSRSSMILSILLPFIFKFNKKKYSIKHLLVMNFGMIFSTLLLVTFMDKLLSIDLTGRDVIWLNLLQSIKINPIFGIGFGLSYETILKPLGLKGTHNAYLLVLSEVGLIGFLLFLTLNVVAIKNLFKLTGLVPKNGNLVSGALTLIFMILIYELFEGGVLGFSGLHFFWVYIITFSSIITSQNINKNGVKEH